MSAVTRYILSELIKVFLVALLAMTALFLFTDTVKQLQNQGLGAGQIVQAMPFLLPFALRTAMQGALLFAVCNVYGRMSVSNEIVAVKSMGISPMKLVWPAVAFVAIPLSLICVWLDDLGSTWGHNGLQRIIICSTDDVAYSLLKTHRSFKKKHFAIAVKNVEGRKLVRPALTYEPPGESQVVTITAEEGELRVDDAASRLSMIMRKGKISVPKKFEMSFDDTIEQTLPLDSLPPIAVTPQLIAQQRERVEALREKVAQQEPRSLSQRHAALGFQTLVERFHTEERYLAWMQTKLNQKWSNSFCCLAFAMIGIPVAIRLRRADFVTSFLICFLPIASAYQPLQFVGSSLAASGKVPAFTVWFGNLALLGIGCWLLRKVEKH